jgi:anaerobic selenocysteine-containing dehydrogenase
VHVAEGKVTKVEGDPESPHNKGKLCAKGYASVEYLYHPDRLKYPLRRMGKRGSGEWERISWEQALELVAGGLTEAKDRYGAEAVIVIRGGLKGGLQDDCLGRFANVFGTPNITSSASVCFVPQMFAERLTYGFKSTPDYTSNPACTIIWGINNLKNHFYNHDDCEQALEKGAKLIVVDPVKTDLAKRADLWAQLRPSTDLALALGMIHVIVNEGLYDKDFVNDWTVGFEELKTQIEEYTPVKVAEITWVDEETIREMARLYATNKPATLESGNAIDNSVNCFQNGRALGILRAITGNIGVPGGDIQWSPVGLVSRHSPAFDLREEIPPEMRDKRASKQHGLIPFAFFTVPQDVSRATLEETPYAFHAAYIQGANPLITHPNAMEVYDALQRLDFIAVADLFMTPTAELADVVLPVASYLEFDSIRESENNPIATVCQQKVAQIGECRSDRKILNELAKKLGMSKYVWEHEDELLDELLKPKDITFDSFRKEGTFTGAKVYRKHEQDGFQTPSKKVEIYSNRLEKWGFDPIPKYYEPPETPYSDPELSKKYPLIFTSYKQAEYWHSAHRQIKFLRDAYPDPVVRIHPETAQNLEIAEGEEVFIETHRGRIKQKAQLTTDIDPRVVVVDYAWWYPEKGIDTLHGWAESNINILTSNRPPFNREMGSSCLKGLVCRVYKAA